MDKYTYRIGLPALGADDVVMRELHVMIDGVEEMNEISDISMTSYDLVLSEGSDCIVYMIDIDDAGNRSKKGTPLAFQVIDIVPPVAPDAPVVADVVLYEEPVAEEPVAEEPVAEEPVAEEPVAEEPVAEEPVAEEPVAEEPVAEEPVAEEPVAEEPVVEEPVAEEPVAEEPVAEDDNDEEVIA